MKPVIILLSGKQGSGKSSIQEKLVQAAPRIGRRAVSINFADSLYALAHAVQSKMENDFGKPAPHPKDGLLLQLLGTEWGRKVHGENVWVDILKNRIENKLYDYDMFVVADCRFKNEFESFPEALRVRLHAEDEARKARTTSWRENTIHQSEIDLDGYAGEGFFDLYLRTDDPNINALNSSELILAQIQKNTWLEKRGVNK